MLLYSMDCEVVSHFLLIASHNFSFHLLLPLDILIRLRLKCIAAEIGDSMLSDTGDRNKNFRTKGICLNSLSWKASFKVGGCQVSHHVYYVWHSESSYRWVIWRTEKGWGLLKEVRVPVADGWLNGWVFVVGNWIPKGQNCFCSVLEVP